MAGESRRRRIKYVVIKKLHDTTYYDATAEERIIEGEKVLVIDDSLPYSEAVRIKVPAFLEGEILIIDAETHIELPQPCRKFWKFDVDVEMFDNLEDAIRRSLEIGGWDISGTWLAI